jgi:hypothetical protein
MLRSRMSGAVTPLPQYVFRRGAQLKHRDNFTFYLHADAGVELKNRPRSRPFTLFSIQNQFKLSML